VGGGQADRTLQTDSPRRPDPGGRIRKGAIYNGHGVLRNGSQCSEEEGQWVGGKLTGKISHRNGSVVEVQDGVVGSGTQAVRLA
jgi:hypothetical protein